jgi:hypothetical protein
MATNSRVANWRLPALLSERVPFTNYNASITAEIVGGTYRVTHWRTTILEYDLATSTIGYFEFGYISQTTSALQGKIIRSLFTPENIRDLFYQFTMVGNRRHLRRLKGMTRMSDSARV